MLRRYILSALKYRDILNPSLVKHRTERSIWDRKRKKEVLTPIEAAKYWIKSEKDPDGFTIKPAANGTGTSGIVATKEFEKGAFLLAYKDSVTTTEEAKILGKEPMKEFLLLKCHSQWGELCVMSKKSSSSLASHVTTGSKSEVNCELKVVKHSDGSLYLSLFANKKIKPGQELKLKHGMILSRMQMSTLIAFSTAGIAGITTVVVAPLVPSGIGFTSAGIAAGSIAAGMMSSAAIASGGGVAAGSMVAVLQSVGATGISGTASAAIGTSVAAVTGGITKLWFLFKKKKTKIPNSTKQEPLDSPSSAGDAKTDVDCKTEKKMK